MSVPILIPPGSDWLARPEAVVLDASWLYEPPPGRDAKREFDQGPRFPNARWWDLETVSEPHPEGYALMLPSPERFAAYASEKGIDKDSHVIVYDGGGVFAAPRTAWTFKVYGHEKVSIINGGLPRAIKEGRALETGPPRVFEKTSYPVPSVRQGAVVEYEEILQIAARSDPLAGSTVLVDARPRAAYEAGHIPSSLSFDFPTALLSDPAGFTQIRDGDDLRRHLGELLGRAVADEVLAGDATVVNTCGGGLSAAINWAQLQSLGVDSRLYDESWGGYSARPDTPRVTGPHPL